jgi:hypothetical protein
MASLRLPAIACACLLGGCSPLIYVLAGGGDEGEDGTIALGQTVSSNTSGSDDDHDPNCGNTSGGPDDAWRFVAPAGGNYRFRIDASYDSVLAVYEGGSELGCNDDYGSTSASQLVLSLSGGETYTVVVDGYSGRSGSYSLLVDQNVDAPPTPVPPTPVPPVPVPPTPVEDIAAVESRCVQAAPLGMGTTNGILDPSVSHATVACGSGGRGGEVIYRLIVEVPSTLALSEASDYDAILELRRGCSEGHVVVACVDDAPDTRHSAIQTHVDPGTYYVIVDSYTAGTGGPFTLDVALTPDPQL